MRSIDMIYTCTCTWMHSIDRSKMWCHSVTYLTYSKSDKSVIKVMMHACTHLRRSPHQHPPPVQDTVTHHHNTVRWRHITTTLCTRSHITTTLCTRSHITTTLWREISEQRHITTTLWIDIFEQEVVSIAIQHFTLTQTHAHTRAGVSSAHREH